MQIDHDDHPPKKTVQLIMYVPRLFCNLKVITQINSSFTNEFQIRKPREGKCWSLKRMVSPYVRRGPPAWTQPASVVLQPAVELPPKVALFRLRSYDKK